MANVDIDKEMSAIKFMEDGLNAHLKDYVIRELEAKYTEEIDKVINEKREAYISTMKEAVKDEAEKIIKIHVSKIADFTAWRDALKVDVQFSDEDKKRE